MAQPLLRAAVMRARSDASSRPATEHALPPSTAIAATTSPTMQPASAAAPIGSMAAMRHAPSEKAMRTPTSTPGAVATVIAIATGCADAEVRSAGSAEIAATSDGRAEAAAAALPSIDAAQPVGGGTLAVPASDGADAADPLPGVSMGKATSAEGAQTLGVAAATDTPMGGATLSCSKVSAGACGGAACNAAAPATEAPETAVGGTVGATTAAAAALCAEATRSPPTRELLAARLQEVVGGSARVKPRVRPREARRKRGRQRPYPSPTAAPAGDAVD